MAGSALRRLMAEYKRKQVVVVCVCGTINDLLPFTILFIYFFLAELTLNPPEGIVAGPISEDNFFEWEALIA